MKNTGRAALVYTFAVFAVGFLLGTLRVFIVGPRIGEARAILLELPVMIAASYLLALWTLRRLPVAPQILPRLVMGALSFGILMLLETALSLAIFGNSLPAHLAHYLEPSAWPGLAGQVLFAAIPLLLLAQQRLR